ncbi:MAG: hypothetical protein R3E83_02000 [Burkholderiaceae bacterium]
MKEDIDALGVRIERLLGIMKRLTADNARLQAQLSASEQANEQMRRRMDEARTRVEAALARLPVTGQSPTEETA